MKTAKTLTTAVANTVALALLALSLWPTLVSAQSRSPRPSPAASAPVAAPAPCTNRGALDTVYCDANRDLVADVPPPGQTVSPQRLVLGFTAVGDAQAVRRNYTPLVEHLVTCLKREVREVQIFPPTSEGAVLEAMRTGQVHIGQFATGGAMFAVNFAGGVPFAARGVAAQGKRNSYSLMLIVRADSAYRKPSDLIGKKIAHTSRSSNSGNLAPRALFPDLGLTPEKDYTVEYSGKHENSVQGVALGLYEGAAIASDVLEQMVVRGEVKRNQFRVLYESEPFPTDSFARRHDLSPKLALEIDKCFMAFRFPESMSRALDGTDRFFPVTYDQDWRVVRLIARASGTKIDKEAYQKLVDKK